MMRTGCLLLVLALAGPGCLSSGTHVETESRKTPPVKMPEPPPPPAVTADQISEANAANVVQALNREMDFESGNPAAAPAPSTTNASVMKP